MEEPRLGRVEAVGVDNPLLTPACQDLSMALIWQLWRSPQPRVGACGPGLHPSVGGLHVTLGVSDSKDFPRKFCFP